MARQPCSTPVTVRRSRLALGPVGRPLPGCDRSHSSGGVRQLKDSARCPWCAASVRGEEVLEREDLAVANVASDPALGPVPVARLDSLLGQRTTVGLTAGSLLTEAAVTAQLQPGTGRWWPAPQ